MRKSESPSQELIKALMQVFLEAEPQMEETINWNRITFTLNCDAVDFKRSGT